MHGVRAADATRVKRFIELHAFEQLAIRDIASEAALSPFTLVRQFRSATGTSPYAYLLELRLARAKELLRTSDVSIRAVAERVGFRDPAYFSRLFANAVGCPPTVFRSRLVGRARKSRRARIRANSGAFPRAKCNAGELSPERSKIVQRLGSARGLLACYARSSGNAGSDTIA